MALSFTTEDQAWLKAAMREVLAEGFAAVGMGYDTTDGQRALQADQQWVRSSRLNDESRGQQVRKGFWSLAVLAGTVALLYVLAHAGSVLDAITKAFTSGAKP